MTRCGALSLRANTDRRLMSSLRRAVFEIGLRDADMSGSEIVVDWVKTPGATGCDSPRALRTESPAVAGGGAPTRSSDVRRTLESTCARDSTGFTTSTCLAWASDRPGDDDCRG